MSAFDILSRSAVLLDILIEIERVIDGLGLYAYGGWEDAEILVGPRLARHDVTVVFAFDPAILPPPASFARLERAGVRVRLVPARLEYFVDRQRARTVYGSILGDTPDSSYRRTLSQLPAAETKILVLAELVFPRRMVDLPLRAHARAAADEIVADDIDSRLARGRRRETTS